MFAMNLASHIADHPAGFGGLSHNTIGAALRKDSEFWHVQSQQPDCMPLLQILICQHMVSCGASCVVGD